MKLEDQVCSLKLAKRLKELGVKQESQFYWGEYKDSDKESFLMNCGNIKKFGGACEYSDHEFYFYSAFTVAELGEMLPKFVVTEKYLCSDKWRFNVAEYETLNQYCFHDNKEADARAKMLIYLFENKLVKP